jgi:catechol 2,3-dioxygenase-like lactoylglutathione lyase family enzyme
MVKAYQDMYGKKMEQYRNKEISIAEVNNFAYIEKFGSFKDVDLYINPLDGSASVAFMEDKKVDGKTVRTMKQGQDNLMSVGAMKQLMNTPIPRYDMEKQSTGIADGMGEEIKLMIDNGIIKSYQNIRQRIYGKGVLTSENPEQITGALINSNIDGGGITITETTIEKDKENKDVEVRKTTNFQDREDLLAAKYLELKKKNKADLTSEEQNLLFQVEKSLKGSNEDQDQLVRYEEIEREIIRSNLGTDYNYTSALMDNNVKNSKNKQFYRDTFDPEEAKKNPNMILKEIVNGTVQYKLTPEQKKDAEDAIVQQVRLRLDQKEEFKGTIKTPEQLRQEAEIARRKVAVEEKKANEKPKTTKEERDEWRKGIQIKEEANFIYNLYNGTPEQIQRAIEFYENDDELGIKEIQRTVNGIKVIYDDEGKVYVDIPFFVGNTSNPIGGEYFFDSAWSAFHDNKYLKEAKGNISNFEKNPTLDKETLTDDYSGAQRSAQGVSVTRGREQQGPLQSKAGTTTTGRTTLIPRPK